MNKLLSFAMVSAICTSAAMPISAAETNPAKASIVLSNFAKEAVAVPVKPGWFVANKMEQNGTYLLQILPPGGSAKDPKVLINVVSYAGLKTTARAFAKKEQSRAPHLVKPGKMEFKFIEQSTPNDVIFQLTLTGNPKLPDQFEVHRVLVGKDGLHRIIYHVEPATQTPERITEMIDLVKGVKLVESVKEAPAGASK